MPHDLCSARDLGRAGQNAEDGTFLCPGKEDSMGEASELLCNVRKEEGEGDTAAWSALATLAADMDEAGRERENPIREVFSLIGDRWTMLILLALEAGTWRHATLKRIIGALSAEGAISQRMLTLKLRALERDGFVARTVSDDVPPHVDYRLSESGRALLEEANRLLGWVRNALATIEAARRRFDREES
jgi:DNA-binding HxlR family transcriptional regulator